MYFILRNLCAFTLIVLLWNVKYTDEIPEGIKYKERGSTFEMIFRNISTPILCYDCNSAFDPRCGEEFDSFSLGIVNCSLRDPPEHLPHLESTICRSIKMEIHGKVRIVRKCGYILDPVSEENSCQRRSGFHEMFVTYCSCATDLCNRADPVQAGVTTLALLAAIVFAVV